MPTNSLQLALLFAATVASDVDRVATSLPCTQPPASLLSAADWRAIEEAHGVAQRTIVEADSGWRGTNPRQELRAHFDGRGVDVVSSGSSTRVGLELRAHGTSSNLTSATTPLSVDVSGTKVSYRWSDTLVEWWDNGAEGIEHGFTLQSHPTGGVALDTCDTLLFRLGIRGDLRAEITSDARSARFVDTDGNVALTYSGLLVYDATGRSLAARFEAHEAGLDIAVESAGAIYPITIDPILQTAYLKASNTGAGDRFGHSIAASCDTVVVGAPFEDSNATGVGGDQLNELAPDSGAVYVYVRTLGGAWQQQAYLKASNTGPGDQFGHSVAIDRDTLVVGAVRERSNATGVNGNQLDNSFPSAGAAYVFVRNGSTWQQQAYLKASNTDPDDVFGGSCTISGERVAIGANHEDSAAVGIGGNQSDNSAAGAGAVYVFARVGTSWSQQAYVKASNTQAGDAFGLVVSLSGATLAVGAYTEDSAALGVNGDQLNNGAVDSGAAYVFHFGGIAWQQEAYLKASNTGAQDLFGWSLACSADTLVVAAKFEDSDAVGVGGDQGNNNMLQSGAAYVFRRTGATWQQEAYLKASNTGIDDEFGWSVGLSGDTALVSAYLEDSGATGVDGDQLDNSVTNSGAAYLFRRSGATWRQFGYLKASNTGSQDRFGFSVAVSGGLAVLGARGEQSAATGINGDQLNNFSSEAGAAYPFDVARRPVGGLEDLGTLGGTSAGAKAVSADGKVIVGSSGTISTGIYRAFRWTAQTGMQDLGSLGGFYSGAHAVNADGSVIVGDSRDSGNGETHAFRWTAATGMLDLGTLGGANSAALGVSSDGSVVVGRTLNAGSVERAFRWTAATGMQDLGTLGGGSSMANGVSSDGLVVVGSSNDASGRARAFRWTGVTGMQDLGTLGGANAEARAISSDGTTVVGMARDAGNNSRAFRWSVASGMQDIGALSTGGTATANGVSADGSVIVGIAENTIGAQEVFRWTAAAGMHGLGQLEGGYSSQAWGVSANGAVIVGEARDAGNLHSRALLWDTSDFGTRYCDAVANSTGRAAQISAHGTDLVACDDMSIAVEFLPLNSFGYFLTSRDQGNTYPVGNTQGRLCLGGFIGRYSAVGQIRNSGATGSFTLVITLGAIPSPLGPVVGQPGDTWNFQAWYRDANPTVTSNFTDALSVMLR